MLENITFVGYTVLLILYFYHVYKNSKYKEEINQLEISNANLENKILLLESNLNMRGNNLEKLSNSLNQTKQTLDKSNLSNVNLSIQFEKYIKYLHKPSDKAYWWGLMLLKGENFDDLKKSEGEK